LSYDIEWQYISVRRLFIFVEQSILKSTKAFVFRVNDERLWKKLTSLVSRFLRGVFQVGGLKGTSESEAFFVKIDSTTTTPADILAGRLIAEIGLAPQRPAEFLVFRLSQFDGSSVVTE
jgi:hypothetical protein